MQVTIGAIHNSLSSSDDEVERQLSDADASNSPSSALSSHSHPSPSALPICQRKTDSFFSTSSAVLMMLALAAIALLTSGGVLPIKHKLVADKPSASATAIKIKGAEEGRSLNQHDEFDPQVNGRDHPEAEYDESEQLDQEEHEAEFIKRKKGASEAALSGGYFNALDIPKGAYAVINGGYYVASAIFGGVFPSTKALGLFVDQGHARICKADFIKGGTVDYQGKTQGQDAVSMRGSDDDSVALLDIVDAVIEGGDVGTALFGGPGLYVPQHSQVTIAGKNTKIRGGLGKSIRSYAIYVRGGDLSIFGGRYGDRHTGYSLKIAGVGVEKVGKVTVYGGSYYGKAYSYQGSPVKWDVLQHGHLTIYGKNLVTKHLNVNHVHVSGRLCDRSKIDHVVHCDTNCMEQVLTVDECSTYSPPTYPECGK